jgi:hypothetical protein
MGSAANSEGSEHGFTRSKGGLREWLDDAGFKRFETLDIGTHSPAIVATRR